MTEIRRDPITPTVSEKKKNIGFAKSSASANRVFHNRAADKAKLARV
jgi:hypothetical protein